MNNVADDAGYAADEAWWDSMWETRHLPPDEAEKLADEAEEAAWWAVKQGRSQ